MAKNQQHKAWHTLSADAVVAELKTSTEQGLSREEHAQRQKEYGKNQLPSKKPVSVFIIFLRQFRNPLIYVLLLAGVVSIAIGEYTDAYFIIGILMLNATIGTVQEWSAEKNAASLQKLLVITAHLKREGHITDVDATELVPGDVVILESGLRVPADIRLVETHKLKVDESLLTGESKEINKEAHQIIEEGVPLGDRKNMVFAGSTVITGRGLGVVTNTGGETELGEIAHVLSTTESEKPPLLIRIERFARQISYFTLIAISILALIAYFKGMEVNEIFFFAVALAVSAIPEGLPVAITVALSIATRRMAKRNVIVRSLNAVEALGSITHIASDKTGTLTVNKQTIKKIVLYSRDTYVVTGEGFNGDGEIELTVSANHSEENILEKLIIASTLANESTLEKDHEDWKFSGDAMDIGFLALAYKFGLEPENIRSKYPLKEIVPYESENKFSAAFFETDNSRQLAVKGAPDLILPYCSNLPGRAAIEHELDQLITEGFRVLAVAGATDLPQDLNGETLIKGQLPELHLFGLVGFIDPLRPKVKDSIKKVQEAGVNVSVVTGDHPKTAFGIGKELGIAEFEEDMRTGVQLQEEADGGVSVKLYSETRIYARVSPLQKHEIVNGLNREGAFVAVTGDGVNDVPALKSAHVGVVMGSGTDLAKETASIIITNDDFRTIEAGIEEGRFAYDNIRKVTYLLISTGAAEIVLFMLSLLANLPIPLMAVQLLWLNLVTNGVQDKALAFEGGEHDVMKRPPRNPKEGIFNRLMVEQVGISGAWIGLVGFGVWYYLISIGTPEKEARNILLFLMVLFENVHVFNCRSERKSTFRVALSRNKLLIAAVIVAQGIHLASMYIPVMEDILEVQPISLTLWLQLAALALSVLGVMEIYKWVKFGRR